MSTRDKKLLPLTLPLNPTLADLLDTMARAVSLGINVSMPARVVTYNATTQKADVTLDLLAVMYNANAVDGEDVQEATQVRGVPVMWPRTAGGYLTFPLVPDDTGLVVFADRSLEQWKRLGVAVDPEAAWAHALQDAVFMPGLHPDTDPISPATDLTAAVLEGTLVKLGRTATEKGIKATTFEGVIDAIFAAATPVAMDGGASLLATAQAAWTAAKAAGLYKTTKVQVE